MKGSYAKHQDLIARFKILSQKEIPNSRTFDRTVGCFMTMRGNRIQINKAGMADCYMLVPTKNGLIHLELEFKTGKAKLSKYQLVWKDFIINNLNGIYILVRNEYAAITEIKKELENLIS